MTRPGHVCIFYKHSNGHVNVRRAVGNPYHLLFTSTRHRAMRRKNHCCRSTSNALFSSVSTKTSDSSTHAGTRPNLFTGKCENEWVKNLIKKHHSGVGTRYGYLSVVGEKKNQRGGGGGWWKKSSRPHNNTDPFSCMQGVGRTYCQSYHIFCWAQIQFPRREICLWIALKSLVL